MSEVWLSLKKTLHCKPNSSEVHDPMASRQKKKQGKIDSSNIKDFIHGSKSNSEKPQSCTSKSKGSSSILNPITHEIFLDSSSQEIKICLCCPYPQSNEDGKGVEGPHRSRRPTVPSRKTHYVDCKECILLKPRVLVQKDSNDPPTLTRHLECGEKLKSLDAVEEQDISEHSVMELHKEDSSWQIIEKICQTSYIDSESKAAQIECVLKVLNTQKTFACFEECREMVRNNVEKLQNKHPRCLADGNELLRFHGTTIACSLGINGCSILCILDQCGVCQILRHGFSTNQEFHGAFGVFTTSTSEKAFDSIGSSDEKPSRRKSVIVCRVIAGRIHNPLQEIQEMADSRFDSLTKRVSCHSDIEELYVLNPRAILPCFVVIYKL